MLSRASSVVARRLSTAPGKPDPFSKTFRDHIRDARPQLTLIGLAFCLTVVGGQNVGYQNEIKQLQAESQGKKTPNSKDLASSITPEHARLIAKEVSHRAGNAIMSEASTSWLRGKTIDEDAIERVVESVQEETRDVVETVAKLTLPEVEECLKRGPVESVDGDEPEAAVAPVDESANELNELLREVGGNNVPRMI